jgi:hypothetical protein
MTYLEAAATVLKDAGEPAHYKEITTRALERGADRDVARPY